MTDVNDLLRRVLEIALMDHRVARCFKDDHAALIEAHEYLDSLNAKPVFDPGDILIIDTKEYTVRLDALEARQELTKKALRNLALYIQARYPESWGIRAIIEELEGPGV